MRLESDGAARVGLPVEQEELDGFAPALDIIFAKLQQESLLPHLEIVEDHTQIATGHRVRYHARRPLRRG